LSSCIVSFEFLLLHFIILPAYQGYKPLPHAQKLVQEACIKLHITKFIALNFDAMSCTNTTASCYSRIILYMKILCQKKTLSDMQLTSAGWLV